MFKLLKPQMTKQVRALPDKPRRGVETLEIQPRERPSTWQGLATGEFKSSQETSFQTSPDFIFRLAVFQSSITLESDYLLSSK
jgi:hypothetical protein